MNNCCEQIGRKGLPQRADDYYTNESLKTILFCAILPYNIILTLRYRTEISSLTHPAITNKEIPIIQGCF